MADKEVKLERSTKEKELVFGITDVNEMFTMDEETKELTKRLKQHTVYGDLTLYEFELLIKNRVIFYIRTGIAKTVENKIKQQVGPNYQPEMTLRALLDFARYEILYGLQPLIHTDWIRETIYIKADGYLYYAKDKLKSLRWEVENRDGITVVRCYASDGNMEVVGEEYLQGKVDSNTLEKAKTKSMRRALRRLFPIGGDELYDEVTGMVVSNNIDEIF